MEKPRLPAWICLCSIFVSAVAAAQGFYGNSFGNADFGSVNSMGAFDGTESSMDGLNYGSPWLGGQRYDSFPSWPGSYDNPYGYGAKPHYGAKPYDYSVRPQWHMRPEDPERQMQTDALKRYERLRSGTGGPRPSVTPAPSYEEQESIRALHRLWPQKSDGLGPKLSVQKSSTWHRLQDTDDRDFQIAIDYYERTNKPGRLLEAKELYGRKAFADNDYASAIERYEELLPSLAGTRGELDPSALQVQADLIEAYIATNNPQKASWMIDRAYRNFGAMGSVPPELHESRLRIANAQAYMLQQLGDLAGASAILNRHVFAPGQSIDDPQVATAKYIKGRIAAQMGDDITAIRVYGEALAGYRKAFGETSSEVGAISFELGSSLEKLGDPWGGYSAYGQSQLVLSESPAARSPVAGGQSRSTAEPRLAITEMTGGRRVGEVSGPYWNAALEDKFMTPLGRRALTPGKPVTVRLELSSVDYSQFLPESIPGAPAAEQLAELLESDVKQVALRVRPFATGPVSLGRETPKEHHIVVDLDKLRQPTDPGAITQALQQGLIELAELPEKLRAGGVIDRQTRRLLPIEMGLEVSSSSGCATVGFSVWDEFGTTPLDHVIFRLAVGDETIVEDCLIDQSAAPFYRGFRSLLARSGCAESACRQETGAALHIFEYQSGLSPENKTTHVIFAQRVGDDMLLRDWRLPSGLSDQVGSELAKRVSAAQKETRQAAAYESPARRLYEMIFVDVAQTERDKQAAADAWQAIRTLSANHTTLLVHHSDALYQQQYLPFGLLRVASEDIRLEPQLEFRQALQVGRRFESRQCVSDWAFMLPRNLSGPDLSALLNNTEDPIARDTSGLDWVVDVFETVDKKLIDYLQDRLPRRKTSNGPPSEGLLILAHQHRGSYWFLQQHNPFTAHQINRIFTPGSAAIFAACSVADTDADNRMAINKLARNGVDLIIASPFPVLSKYGALLAKEMNQRIRDISNDPDPSRDRRLVTIFDAANMAVSNQLKQSNAGNPGKNRYDAMRNEFVFIGNTDLVLCRPEQRG